MRDLKTLTHFEPLEKIVDILKARTQNEDPHFSRVLVAYYFCKVASIMRCSVDTKDRGNMPVNMYAVSLAVSGYGKNLSVNILEGEIINKFRETFIEQTLPSISERRINEIAGKRSIKKATDPAEEIVLVEKEYKATGEFLFSFDSGTSPAFKQQRDKLLMVNAGSLNLEIDEIGSNISKCSELLSTYLETFDQGLIKQKLIKNTTENTRTQEIYGKVPSNLLMFGTPAKLLNGDKEEEEFMTLLSEGYGRRCFFGSVPDSDKRKKKSATELYESYVNPAHSEFISEFSSKLGLLASEVNMGKRIKVSREVSILLIEYILDCEERAEKYPPHEELRRAEIMHRGGKALKLAGAYAFIDGSYEITEELLYNAIKLAEDSGEAFDRILNRDRNYVTLAKYIATVNKDVTLVDLTEDLPFFKGSLTQKNELLSLAITYGYKNNIVIKKDDEGSITFYRGESLEKTNINNLLISYSVNSVLDYKDYSNKFRSFDKLVSKEEGYWSNHHYGDSDRVEGNVVEGFNVIAFNIDLEVSISALKELLKEYIYFLYLHDDIFTIVFPISHIVNLDKDSYKQFINNIKYFMPFNVIDDKVPLRSERFGCNKTKSLYNNDGDIIDILKFIPNTSKEEEWHESLEHIEQLTNLERWYFKDSHNGSKIKSMIKYGQILSMSGLDIESIKTRINELNFKLKPKLSIKELSKEVFTQIGTQSE